MYKLENSIFKSVKDNGLFNSQLFVYVWKGKLSFITELVRRKEGKKEN